MKSSSNEYKRARPAFGTVLRLETTSSESAERVESALSAAFALAEELESKFSKFRAGSELRSFNSAPCGVELKISSEFAEVLLLANQIFKESCGAFNPYISSPGELEVSQRNRDWFARKLSPCSLDLSGIAKGYCVDRLSEFLEDQLPSSSGVVNAGGDLRFFNTENRQTAVRLANQSFRLLRVDQDGVATSSFAECLANPLSTTVYSQSPRPGLEESDSVTVVAPDCALADALTKAGWFANEDSLRQCVRHFHAQVLVFDKFGKERCRYQ